MLERPPKKTGFDRDGEKHVEQCLDASQSFSDLALFFVDMYFRANVTLYEKEGRNFLEVNF